MLEPNKQAEFDQSATLLGEVLPQLWYRLYSGSVNSGFTKAQALELVKIYILSQSANGITLPNPPGESPGEDSGY